VPDKAKAGWIQRQVAEQPLFRGGIGIPNIYTELKALSAMAVGAWAMSTRPQQQVVGDILQRRHPGRDNHLIPNECRPIQELSPTMWATGRPWAELHFSAEGADPTVEMRERQQLREALRFSLGTLTTWTTGGLRICCTGRSREVIRANKVRRRKEFGQCTVETIRDMPLRLIWLGDAQGNEVQWNHYRSIYASTAKMTVGQVMTLEFEHGAVVFKPITHELPMRSGIAHRFREVCLSLVANFPELIGKQQDGKLLHVTHAGEDPHHVFEVGGDGPARIMHTWGTCTTEVEWSREEETIETAVARRLGTDATKVAVEPHPQLTRMKPLWTGKRRWRQTRKMYKQLINKQRDVDSAIAVGKLNEEMAIDNARVAAALQRLSWKQVYRMEGVSAYQTQNIYKLKMNRLRLWAGQEAG